MITGNNLDGTNIGVAFSHPLWSAPIELPPQAGSTATAVRVAIPNAPANWPAGFWTVTVVLQRPSETYRRTTNELSLALAPAITIAPASAAGPSITYTVTCAPDVRPSSARRCCWEARRSRPQAHTTQTATLDVPGAEPGGRRLLRPSSRDGVDSLLIDRAVTPPVFDATQKVTVT